jgi:tRNA (guanine-N7-)-methyltransferase
VPKITGSPGYGTARRPGDDKSASPRAFFGRRKGQHPLKARQTELFGELLPRLALELSRPADLAALFRDAEGIRLEIGFGGAEHLIDQAQKNPQCGFIGCDGFATAIAKALTAIDDHAIANVRLHFGDASELLDWLPARSLERVDLLYPDPWPKRRHWKRRFIQDDTLNRLSRILKIGGELRFATDIADYAAYSLARVMRSPSFIWTAEKADDWRQPWDGFTRTRYEAKAIREGRAPGYFIFRNE